MSEPYYMDRDVLRATMAGGYAVCCGALLRWPSDMRLRAEGIRLASDELAMRFAFGDLLARLDRLCVTPETRYARTRITFAGMKGLTWGSLPERIEALEHALGRQPGTLAARVRELEMDPRETSSAVVLAVAEVMRAQWAAQAEPRPEDTPGTPEYRARLRADLAADAAGCGVLAARWDRLIALDRAGR